MKLSKELTIWLEQNDYSYKIDYSEHLGCFSKGCSHLEEELVVWRNSDPTNQFCFRGISEEKIKKKLDDYFYEELKRISEELREKRISKNMSCKNNQ